MTDFMFRGEGYKKGIIFNADVKIRLQQIVSEAKTNTDFYHLQATIQDSGTCCLGQGISVKIYENGRQKYPRKYMIVTGFTQGSTSNYQITKPLIEYIKAKYPEIDAYYEYGNMD